MEAVELLATAMIGGLVWDRQWKAKGWNVMMEILSSGEQVDRIWSGDDIGLKFGQ